MKNHVCIHYLKCSCCVIPSLSSEMLVCAYVCIRHGYWLHCFVVSLSIVSSNLLLHICDWMFKSASHSSLSCCCCVCMIRLLHRLEFYEANWSRLNWRTWHRMCMHVYCSITFWLQFRAITLFLNGRQKWFDFAIYLNSRCRDVVRAETINKYWFSAQLFMFCIDDYHFTAEKRFIYVQSESHNSAIDWTILTDGCSAWQHIAEEKENEQRMKKHKVIDIFYSNIFFALRSKSGCCSRKICVIDLFVRNDDDDDHDFETTTKTRNHRSKRSRWRGRIKRARQ